jgi:hypothetical protein
MSTTPIDETPNTVIVLEQASNSIGIIEQSPNVISPVEQQANVVAVSPTEPNTVIVQQPPYQEIVVVQPTGPAGADGKGVPSGGTTGQVLAKTSNTDYDTEWVDESGGTYTGQSPTTIAVGGIPANTNISSASFTSIFQEMLIPYIAPSFSSFSMAGQSQIVEVGTALNGVKAFNFSFSQFANVSASTLAILDITSSSVLVSNAPITSPQNANIGTITLSSAGSYSWQARAQNSQSSTFSSSPFTVSWQWMQFFGTNTNPTLTATQIQALAGAGLSPSLNGTYSFGTGGYKFFAWPNSFGSPTALTGFKDTSNNLPMAMASSADNIAYNNVYNGWYYALVPVTNSNGITTNYRVYRTQNVLSSIFNIAVS